MGQINEVNIISSEIVIVFYYKDCEATLKKSDDITNIKIVGLSDMGNLLIDSQTFIKKIENKLIVKLLKNEEEGIEKVYKNVIDKEYGSDDDFHLKKT